MLKIFNLYVPVEYTFKNYFLPRINYSDLEYFEMGPHRHGIQRTGNNHLLVFLDFCLKKPPSKFTKAKSVETGDFRMRTPAEIKLFKRIFARQKEVAAFSLTYHPRMSVMLWKLLIQVVDDPKIMVRDDSGHLMTGRQCIQEIKKLLLRRN